MKKTVPLILGIFFATVVIAQAQENPKKKRELSVYMLVESGQLAPTNPYSGSTPGRDQFFEGNKAEFGLSYAQNFDQVPWLNMGGNLIFEARSKPIYTDGNLVGFATAGPSAQNFRANIWLGMPYFKILLDTRGLLGAYADYTLNLGEAGKFAVGADLEMFMTGNPWYGNPNPESGFKPGDPGPGPAPEFKPSGHESPIYIVDYFGIWASYSVALPVEGMKFTTKPQLRFNANSWNDSNSVEFDPLASMELRWDNTLGYSVDGWDLYIRLRTSGYGLAGASTPLLKAKNQDPLFVLQAIAGATYTFDFAKI